MTASAQLRENLVRARSAHAGMRRAVLNVLRHWDLTPTGGQLVRDLEETFSRYMMGAHALAVSSGTAALEVALRAAQVGPDDEVVLPAYDWGAATGAVLRCGAKPVFADVDPSTTALDAGSLAARITRRTVAVVVTHWAGCPANLDPILTVARRHGLFVLEDCAQALGALYHSRPVGSFGDAAAFSFGWGKLVCAGEGGMLVFQDNALWRRAVGLSQHPVRQVRDGADGLGDLALNARMHPLAAALVLAQWEMWPRWLERRRRNCLYLSRRLRGLAGVCAPCDPPYGRHSFHRYFIGLPNETVAIQVAQVLNSLGFPVNSGYICRPLHLREPFQGSYALGHCPQAERRCRAALGIEADWTRVSGAWVRGLADALRREIIAALGGGNADRNG